MPIYAYKCSSCGVSKDILRKISDPPLTTCPACGQETLAKQVTAAGFQLKGSGWYVTDFREGQKPATGSSNTSAASQATADKTSETAAPASSDSSQAQASTPAPAAPAPAPATTTSTSGATT